MKKIIRKKILLFSLLFVIFSIFISSYGYAALNTELSISGEAYVRVDESVRITSVSKIESLNGAYETYNSKYSKNSTSMFVTLPNNDSTITYEVEATNKSDSYYILTNILPKSYTNTNISYEIIDIDEGAAIAPQSTVKFKIKFFYSSSVTDNIMNTLVLDYRFSLDEVVAPVITGGSNDWNVSSITIKLLEPGTAVSGVDHYEYYRTQSPNKPSDSSVSSGTVASNGNTVVKSDGTNYIYYRTVSKLGNKSSWSSPQIAKVDSIIPSFTMLPTGTYELSLSSKVVTESSFGPSGGSIKCVNVSNNNSNVTKISSIKMIGTITVKCTATSNAGRIAEKSVNYTLGGLLTSSFGLKCQDISNNVTCSKDGTDYIVSPGYVQFGPYFKAQKGCYKITYSGSGFASNTCQNYLVYQTNPSLDFKTLSLKISSTSVIYYINVTNAVLGNGIEFVLRNGCQTTINLKNIKVEKVNSCPSS